MDVDVEDEPDSYESLVLQDRITEVVVGLCLHPVGGFPEKQVANEHHDEVYDSEYDEHARDANTVLERFHDRRSDCFREAESHDGYAGCQTLVILEPQHQSFNWREVTDTQADSHYAAVENVYQDERENAGAEFDSKTRSDHADRKTDGGDKR